MLRCMVLTGLYMSGGFISTLCSGNKALFVWHTGQGVALFFTKIQGIFEG